MYKPSSLKQHLISSVKELQLSPDKVLVFMDDGNVVCSSAPGLSFEYRYTLKLIITDFAGQPDGVFIPLLAWVGEHQRELLDNYEQRQDAIAFNAEVLANDLVDIEISLPLTERAIVRAEPGGELSVSHPPEPQQEPFLPAGTYQLRDASNELLAEWQSGAPAPGYGSTVDD
ncbi:tail protein [Halopseudomonas oceani]|uniref:Phage tail protein n=1 Tax=Halopseudomonas oceani TaxID=1708783 RepID=A0A2P4EUB1_9GAMM|nr:phage tail protein [Halopseudomonas oceani]POB03022.1 phage tail protein [Halopseudomonas oceani]GGE50603.1 tail protein [Halopseudomonas oceani]